MAITLDIKNKATIEAKFRELWYNAHGEGAGSISSTWGEDRIVIMIDDALFKIENLLANSKKGGAVVEHYLHELMIKSVSEEISELEKIIEQRIDSVQINVDLNGHGLMVILRLDP